MTRKAVNVLFYRTANGREPVKEWLLRLDKDDRSAIGTDLKTVEYGWPLGMPLVRGFSGKANREHRIKSWRRREIERRILSEWEQENDTA